MENNWDAWAKEWENANAFYTSKGNNKTKDNLKSKWNKEFMNILKYFYNEGRRIERDEIKKEITNLKNPYPLDIFPEIVLNENKSKVLNFYLIAEFGFGLDRLSAELMRRARENLKQELLNFLGEKCGICDSNKHNTKEHTDKLMFKEKKNDNNTR